MPFCRSFCTYCDFYSELCPGGGGAGRYASGAEAFSVYKVNVLDEIEHRILQVSGSAYPGLTAPDTIYFGGGTPSVLPLDVVEDIVGALHKKGVSGQDEFTFEVNPDDIVRRGPDYVRSLGKLGVSRISMGVQSFDDGILRWMNRRHSARDAVEAVRILRGEGVRNLSLDLIFGLSQLDEGVWQDTVDKALSLRPEHISAYQLSIEEGSALGRMAAEGKYREASDELCRSQYDALCSRLAAAGYRHYEISNWALPGFEAVHNSAYWRRVPYTGLGPGAHSFEILYADSSASGNKTPIPVQASFPSEESQVKAEKTLQLRSWNSESIGGYKLSSEVLSEKDIDTEVIMLALRTAEGISGSFLRAHSKAVEELLREGVLTSSGDCLRIPEDHFFVSDDIISRLI